MLADDRMSWARRLCGAMVAAVVLVLADSAVARAEPGVPVPPNELLLNKGGGTVSAADRDFVIKVRLAGLWEIPAGDMAQDRSDDPRIKKIGRSIAEQHVVLDKFARTTAKKLRIDLPDEPNSDQQGWLDEMSQAEGPEFDQIYVDRLRAAHGKIFPAIATIRASTRNDTVRRLAQQANQFVMTHLTLLESSEIVDFRALPTAPPPSTGTGAAAGPDKILAAAEQKPSAGLNMTLILGLLAAGLAAGLAATMYVMSGRRRTYHPARRRRYHE
jgi:predicted outer membrane protein